MYFIYLEAAFFFPLEEVYDSKMQNICSETSHA